MGTSYILESSAVPLGRLQIPFKGTWKTLPSHLLPPDALADSMNVVIQSGELKPRAGMESYAILPSANDILTTGLYVSGANIKYPLAVSATEVFAYDGGWYQLTGPSLTTPSSTTPRLTTFSSSGGFDFILTDQTNLYNGSNGTYSVITPTIGSLLPGITDISTSFNRVIVISPPYSLAWSNALNFFEWPVLNTVYLSETPDTLVAVRNLGTLGFAVYKEGSIYTAFAQGSTDAAAFRFEFRGVFEGPANPNALIDVNGVHYGFTPSGRIFRFDGSNHDFIADGIWPFLRDDLDPNYLYKIHGVYNYKTHEIYFFYPRLGDSGAVKGMLLINLPYPLSGIESFSYFLGRASFSCTASLGTVLFENLQTSLVFSSGQSYRLNHDHFYDGVSEIPISLQHGFLSHPNNSIVQPIFQTYLRRGSGRGIVQVQSVVSNMLEENLGTEELEEYIDLSVVVPNEYIGFNNQGSFISVKLSANASDMIRYLGTDVYGIITG